MAPLMRGSMNPQGRREGALHGQDGGNDDVAENQDGEIGRRIIGAVMVECLAAARAGVLHLEVAPEERALAAGRAAPQGANQHRPPYIAPRTFSALLLHWHDVTL